MSKSRRPCSEETLQELLEQTATTTQSFRTICEAINVAASSMWIYLHDPDAPERLEQYTQTKSMQAEMMAEEMCDIADDGRNDLMTITHGQHSYETENREVTNRSKLRVETRKWLLSKLLPKKYGDRQEVRHADPDGKAIQIISMIPRPEPEKPEDVAARDEAIRNSPYPPAKPFADGYPGRD